jgi:tetratricopeptide (TPR) repeat protein
MKMSKLQLMKMFRFSGVHFSRFICAGWVCLLLWCAGLKCASAADTNEAIAQLNKNFQKAGEKYVAETNNPQVAWQFARACFDLADVAPNTTLRADYANRGIEAARQSLTDENNSVAAHYYLGMNIGQLAETKRNLSGLRMVKDMEREFLAACALDERFDYAGPDRNLGLLYEQTPVIVSIGSRAKGRKHLERAVELAPEFPENQLNLIEAYLKWDYHEEAERQLNELEKIWPAAQKKFIGDPWVLSWTDWNKRFNNAKKKIGGNSKVIESPHAAP